MHKKIGRYELLRTLGKGGMGEVWLAHDPLCNREVAIKYMRPELKKHAKLTRRFHKEAHITALLTHPGIISIYEIGEDYYVMPYVQGKTLKTHIYQERPSFVALLPIFISVCQTIAYAHSKGVLHRDIKPENILLGTFGEVILLDWGLAEFMGASEEDSAAETHSLDLTHPGKVVGTVAYMAPERATGHGASIQTDLYALGVILYQILTLSPPFERPPLKDFIKQPRRRFIEAVDPEEMAPYRGISPLLSRIVMKMLAPDPKNRYSEVESVMEDLKIHMEGRASWIESGRLSIHRKEDWQFQEHVLISKHLALTGNIEASDWVNVRVSQAGFSESIRLQTRVKIEEEGAGIGFLLNIPEPADRSSPFDGYCLWLGAAPHSLMHLFRNTIEVMTLPDLCLSKGKWHEIILEKTGRRMALILDGKERMSYISYLPLPGTHVGILSHDANFQMDECLIQSGSQTLRVSCLAIPDTLLAHKHYNEALAEYRRIATCFNGYAEGREARFRAGITLLEQARLHTPHTYTEFHSQALEEFSQLHHTPAAPYEYLGKALVYAELDDYLEEIKCLELGLRRYYKHPLADSLRDHINYRMHETAQTDRGSAYKLMLIVLRLLPEMLKREDNKRLFAYLIKHWEPLPFLESSLSPSFDEPLDALRFAIPIAFWLAAPYTIMEIFEKVISEDDTVTQDALFSLIELGSHELALTLIGERNYPWITPLITCHQQGLNQAWKQVQKLSLSDCGIKELRTFLYLMHYALIHEQEELIHTMAAFLAPFPISQEDRIKIDAYRVWAYLQEEKASAAQDIFDQYPLELLNQETTVLHPLFGCYLLLTEGAEIASIHFNGVIETPHPRSYALLGHELAYHIIESPDWYRNTFMWERRQLYELLTLYYAIAEQPSQEAHFRELAKKEYLSPPPP